MINEYNLLYPIFILFKLLFNLVSNNNQTIITNENEYLYEKVTKYKSFYNEDLLDVLAHVEVLFDKDFVNKKIFLDNKNGITYLVVSNKYLQANKYIESLYYAQKAKEIFLSDENYKKIAYTNLNIMSCYCNLNNYQKYYDLAHTQYHSLKSFNDYGDLEENSSKNYAISLLAVNKYKELENVFKQKVDISFTEVICLLIAKYNINLDDYQKYYYNLQDVLKNDERLEILNIINKFLQEKDRKILKTINKGIHNNLLYVLKNS